MKIVFQGDSVTDFLRNYEDDSDLGKGYVKYAAERIAARHPDTTFTFLNRGISGNKAENLRNRWQQDCIDHDPDLVSILIGVNDTWHFVNEEHWMPDEYFEECYRFLLEEVKQKTHARIMMLEQFILPGFMPELRADLDAKIQITRKLAREYADIFIPLDGIFAASSITVSPSVWGENGTDGVHPSPAGSQLIADLYADAVDKLFSILKKP